MVEGEDHFDQRREPSPRSMEAFGLSAFEDPRKGNSNDEDPHYSSPETPLHSQTYQANIANLVDPPESSRSRNVTLDRASSSDLSDLSDDSVFNLHSGASSGDSSETLSESMLSESESSGSESEGANPTQRETLTKGLSMEHLGIPLYEGAPISCIDSYLMTLHHSLRFSSTKVP